MDNWNHRKPRRKSPSFSSSLLDEIYRSIDDQTPTAADRYKTGKKTDQNVDMMLSNKIVDRKKSVSAHYYYPQSFHLNSCSTSSESSFWTSSESETSKSYGQSKLAVRTSFSSQHHHRNHPQEDDKIYISHRKLKNEKMYGDLKKSKSKQAISPGSRLASFLNSLFTSKLGNTNKAQMEEDERKYKSSNASSACSRSCLSKTPRGKLSEGTKRSVRFYPVISVIMDDDYRYKNNERRNYDNIPARCGEEIRGKNRRAREVLKNYEKKLQEYKMMDDNDDEDCESCVSSDLFELDNLHSIIGSSRQRYCEELPVYETTSSLYANRAIAHALHSLH